MTNEDGRELAGPSKDEMHEGARRVWRKIKVFGLIALIIGMSGVALVGGVAYRALGATGIIITLVGGCVAVGFLVRQLEYY